MTTLIINIAQLAGLHQEDRLLRGPELAVLPMIGPAYLLIEDDVILRYGYMHELELDIPVLPREVVDAGNAWVFPTWCDSHTHLVFARSREDEFIKKIQGMSYAEIAASGGGILNSARRLQETSEDELFRLAWDRLTEWSKMGTGAIEIKSGYGLTLDSELKMLRVIKRLKQASPLTIKASFLGAHAYPESYRDDHEGYIRLLTEQMLPAIAAEGLADYVDVFCENGFFSPAEMETVCRAAAGYGLRPKLHVNQLNSIGGIQKAIELNALSVDHLEVMTERDISDLAASGTIGTLLPTAAFFLRMDYQPARNLIDAGVAVALASDFNPGSSPSGNMPFVMSLSCIQMKMLPAEVVNAATIQGAFAMECERELGSIREGKKANLVFTRPMPSLAYMPYAFGSNLVQRVMIGGSFIS